MSLTGRGRRWKSEPRARPGRPAALQQKLVLFRVIVVALFAILALQLFRLQMIEGSQFESQAASNTLRITPILPERGLIYDRSGKPLVKNIPTYSAAIVPADLPEDDQDRVFAMLTRVLDVRVPEMQLLV